MSKANKNTDNKKASQKVQKEPKKTKTVVKKTNKSTKVRAKSQVTKCERCNKPFSYDPTKEKPALCHECDEADNKIVHRGVCKDCGKEFYVKAKDANFLKSKGLDMSKRCYECRKARKIKKDKETK